MHASLLLFTALLAQTPAEITLRTLEGESLSGKLTQLSESEIVVGEKSFTPAKLESITINDAASESKWPIQINLVDGSAIHATSYAVAKSTAKVTLTTGSSAEIPLKAIANVRLKEHSAELAKQWGEYLAEDATGDRLVVRRKAKLEDGTGESLDVLEGVIREVTDSTVNFDTGGDVLKVKRERVDGLLYFRGRDKSPAGAFTIVDIDGSSLLVRKVALTDSGLKLETPAGFSTELPLAQVRQIDFASANRRYLSDLPRESLIRASWFSRDAKLPSLTFEPLVGRTPQGAISVGGELPNQAIWLPAKSALIVAVPSGCTRFRAQVGIDDRVGNTDGARLLVEADGKTLYDQVHSRESQPATVDIDLKGARRVRITVDFGGESFVGDQLVLGEAAFVK